MSSTTVGIVQLCATADVDANMETSARLCLAAADAGAETIFLPEAFTFIGTSEEKRRILEPLPAGGPLLEHCRNIARKTQTHLVLGGFHEADPASDRAYNTCVHLDTDGEIVASYRKIHLFDVSLEDGTQLRESQNTAPGDEVVCSDLPFGRVGLTVCYDVRFPYLYQALVDQNAIALSVPSAFTATTGAAHWHVLLRARAIECQSYVIAAAQHGEHGNGRRSYGHSLIVDPWGEIIAEISEGEGVAIADIDADRVAAVRRQLPSLQHRRSLESTRVRTRKPEQESP